jgi:pSer/pThr/pTyr-binding forkhead associated (FHA) protein
MQLVVNTGKAQGKFINVTGSRLLIGRDPECQLRPLSEEVSPLHAELKIFADIAVLIDLGSANGTRVNGRTLKGPASLRTGDRIEIGPLSLTALLDEKKPAKRPRRSIEDAIVSWLIDEEDEEEPAPPRARRSTAGAVKETARGADGSSLMDPTRQPAGGADEDAFALLNAMTARPD